MMFSTTLVSVALLIAPAVTAFNMDYPTSVGTCQVLSYSWDSDNLPMDVVIVNPAEPCDDPLIDVGEVDSHHKNTTITLKPGDKIQLSMIDTEDIEGWSAVIDVTDSGDYSCLSDSLAAELSSSAAAAASTSASSAASTSVSVSSTASSSSPSSDVTPPATISVPDTSDDTGASSSQSSSSSSASGNAVPVGAVGTGSDSGATAVGVPVVLLGASLATLFFL